MTKGGAGKTLSREIHMRKLRATLVESLSKDLKNTVETLMEDIPTLRNKASNQNTHEIWVIEQLLLTRTNRNEHFCMERVHEVRESSCLILNGRYFSDWVTQVSL